MNARLAPTKQAEIERKNEARRKAPKKPLEPQQPKGIQLRYYTFLLADLALLTRLINNNIKDDLAKIQQRFDSERLDDDLTEFLRMVFVRVRRLFVANLSVRGKTGTAGILAHYESNAKKIAIQTNGFSWDQFTRQYKRSLGVDPLKNEPFLRRELDLFVTDNVNLVGSMHEEYLSNVQKEVILGFRRGDGSGTIAKKIADQTKITKQRSRLIARDQVAKLNSGLEQKRAQNNGVTRYIWHTNLDSKERPEHRALDGEEFTWAKPPVTIKSGKRAGETNHPGQDIQCRCYAENIYEALQGI